MRWCHTAQNCPVPRHLCLPSMTAWTYRLPLHLWSAMTGAVAGCACGAAAGALAAPANARLSVARIGARRFMRQPKLASDLSGFNRSSGPSLAQRVQGVTVDLGIEHRRDRILRAARVIPVGYWTAYGEIAIAVTGSRAAARSVGRTAARSTAFPNAWRVIHADGSIPEGWGMGAGGPRKCRELLEAEGVRFVNGRADPAKKILAEEIELLLAGER